MIRFFNTLSGKLEEFKPLTQNEVKIYTCGPTVYDYAHIGNFRAFVFEDLLRRFLEFSGYKVKHVMNLTDVDDKTIAGAQRENKKLEEFTEKYTTAFQEDLKALNCLLPNHPAEQPRATREIPVMIDLIAKLIQKGVAYQNGGSVYYKIEKFQDYGKLSKKKLDKNIAGASKRLDADEYDREQISDFVLWKGAKEGEPSWDSPWGKGRPGWHIECSAMSMKYLGETFDIHAGGEDLIFPHHENEIAQSEAATGKKFVNTWLHCKFLLVNGEKMSKSKGNFFTLRDLLAKGHDPMAIRYQLLSTHYRNTLNFTEDGLKEANEVIKRARACYMDCFSALKNPFTGKHDDIQLPPLQGVINAMTDSLENDLNISVCFGAFSGAIRFINSFLLPLKLNASQLDDAINFFKKVDQLLGLKITEVETVPEKIEKMLAELVEHRKNKNFSEADRIRKTINDEGWVVKDGRPGQPSKVVKK